MIFLILLGAVAIVGILFVFAHQRPLTVEEVSTLAQRRRSKAVLQYYNFDRRERAVDKHFKKNMAANGSFYGIAEDLQKFPSLAAGLLKYKKHEWMIIAFERSRNIDKIWLNKGPDKSKVHFGISLPDVENIANRGRYTSVLVFHNHPNSDPSLYSTAAASSRDKETASELAEKLRGAGVNLVEFVCERGSHHEYWRSVSDSFLPLANFVAEVHRTNGVSGSENFSLHWERLFKN